MDRKLFVVDLLLLLIGLHYVSGEEDPIEIINASCSGSMVNLSRTEIGVILEGQTRTVCFVNETISNVSLNGADLETLISLSSPQMYCFNISAVNNEVINGNRTVNVSVMFDCNGSAILQVTVSDSDIVIKVTLNGSSNSLTEGENTTLSVELSMAVAMQVTVNFEPQTSEYYSLYPNPVIIPSRNRSQSVVLSISDVNMLEQSETFTITTNVSITYGNDVQEGNFSFTIIDPEAVTLVWNHTDLVFDVIRGSTFSCCATFEMMPLVDYSYNITITAISGTAQLGTDFTATPVSEVFSASEPVHCITVETINITSGNGSENFTIELNLTSPTQKVDLPDPILVTLVSVTATTAPATEVTPATTKATTTTGTIAMTTEAITFTTTTEAASVSTVGGSNVGAAVATGILVPVALIIIAVLLLLLILFILAKKGKPSKGNLLFGKVFGNPSLPNLVVPVVDGIDGNMNGDFPLVEEKKEARDIALSDFTEHVKSLHEDTNRGFEEEFSTISNPPFSTKTAELTQNREKNRFLNIMPYDNNLVKLKVRGKDESDYINASWIDGYNRKNAYIACQGPVEESVGDFWRLIWQHKFPTIVMVTRLIEGSRSKCHQYWPKKLGEKLHVGFGITLRMDETVPFADYNITKLTLINSEDDSGVNEFCVTHCHYTGWPDHDVPHYPTSLLGFLRRVRKVHPYSGAPLVAHCSAGVGRTGTFMTLDSMLQKIAAEGLVNVLQFVRDLRKKRCFMVQTESQYVFIHDALNEVVTCGNTEIPAMDLRMVKNKLSKVSSEVSESGFMEQFKLLDQLSRKPTKEDCDGSENSPNGHKNRHQDRIPYKLHRPILSGSRYINASQIDGYRSRRAFITTQGPLEHTISDFWQMVIESQSKCIVMVCQAEEKGEECSAVYWPQEVDASLTFDKLTVTLVSESKEEDHDIAIRRLQVEGLSSTTVTQFHHLTWNDDREHPSTKSVLKLCDLVLKAQRSTGNRPITVISSDGSGRSGTFLTIYSEIERLKTEGVIDIFQCIKAARIQRYGLVSNEDQYAFIHEAITDFMDKFDTYANFI